MSREIDRAYQKAQEALIEILMLVDSGKRMSEERLGELQAAAEYLDFAKGRLVKAKKS